MNCVAVCLGRFQPFHLGHYALLSEALSDSEHVIVGVGSAFRARTPRNPFTWEERRDMIMGAFSTEQASRISFVPLRDYFNVDRWNIATAKQIEETLHSIVCTRKPQLCFYGQVPQVDLISGMNNSNWHKKSLPRHGSADASKLRDLLFQSPPNSSDVNDAATSRSRLLSRVASELPGSVLQWLDNHLRTDIWQYLSQEWNALRRIREAWSRTPFPPTFITVDAVIRCDGNVLLIRRGKSPGEGLWALPGGFIEQNETVRDAAIRELYEETQVSLPAQELRRLLVATQVFDHPDRSQLGRVVTHAHFFDLGSRQCPVVQADDDAKIAQWVPIAEIRNLEDQFHDDHFFILDHFLRVLDS